MTVYVETDFLVALAKDDDWLQEEAERALENRSLQTSQFAYLELLFAAEEYDFDYSTLIPNLLELVPVGSDEDRTVVLKAMRYYAEGMTPFDAFHAATAEKRGLDVLSSERDYESIDVDRVPLEPEDTT